MKRDARRVRWFVPVIVVSLFSGTVATQAFAQDKLLLHKDWQLQSSCEVKASGAQISTAGFDAHTWHHSDVPTTVVGALVADKTYPDPNYGMNLMSLPGFVNDRQHFFSNQDMPKDSPFRCSWCFGRRSMPWGSFSWL